jgi:hypothetical protein
MSRDWAMKYRPCGVDGCPDRGKARGLCNRHYQAWYREHRAERKRESDRRWRARTGYNARRRKAPPGPRECPVCGVEFVPATHAQKYCEVRGRCYRAATNAAFRGRPLAHDDMTAAREAPRRAPGGAPGPSDPCSQGRGARRTQTTTEREAA